MDTKTQAAPATAEAPKTANAVTIAGPRLPYPAGVEERFGVDRAGWKTLAEAIFPAAKTSAAIVLALSYCKARKLDPFKRVVHIVPIWDSERRCNVETVWPGIAELRTTAFRTGQYAGNDAAKFGPMREMEFEGETKKGKVKAKIKFPEWCQVTVFRTTATGARVSYPGPRVYWLEMYGRMGRTDVPNEMWQKRPTGQLEKCAEAAALRRAFPEELGNDYTDDEAASIGRAELVDETPAPAAPKREDFVDGAFEVGEEGAEIDIALEDGGEGEEGGESAGGDAPAAAAEESKPAEAVTEKPANVGTKQSAPPPPPKFDPLSAKPTANETTVWLKRLETVLAEAREIADVDRIEAVAQSCYPRMVGANVRKCGELIGARRAAIHEARGGGQ